MTDFQKQVCMIVKAALVQDTAIELADGFDWRALVSLARAHQIVPPVYYGIKRSGVDVPAQVLAQLKSETLGCIVADEKQRHEVHKVLRTFSENGIEHMPLKGVVIKSLYPASEMRMMGDADILIREEQYDRIRPLLLSLGFEEGVKSPHEYVWKKKELYLELHHRTFAVRNKEFVQFYGDGWSKALPSEASPFRFEMDDETTLVYLVAHLAKHYRDCGIGIRHMVDIWLYLRAKPSLNNEKLRSDLTKLKLYDFYINLLHTLDVWFEGAVPTNATELITSRVFSSGSYGNTKSKTVVSVTEMIHSPKHLRFAKCLYLLWRIFPSYKEMRAKYSFLRYCPILLPIMWPVRWLELIVFRQNQVTQTKQRLDQLSFDLLISEQAERHAVGLHFAFEDEE